MCLPHSLDYSDLAHPEGIASFSLYALSLFTHDHVDTLYRGGSVSVGGPPMLNFPMSGLGLLTFCSRFVICVAFVLLAS
jgi:hypothetical protein